MVSTIGAVADEVGEMTADTVAQNVSRAAHEIAGEAAQLANKPGFVFHQRTTEMPSNPALAAGKPSSAAAQLAAGAGKVQKAPIVQEKVPAAWLQSSPNEEISDSERRGYEIINYRENVRAAEQHPLKTGGAPISPKASLNPANLGAKQVVTATEDPTLFKTQLQQETSRQQTATNKERNELGNERYYRVTDLETNYSTAEKNRQMKELTKANQEAKKLDTQKDDAQKQIAKLNAKTALTPKERARLQNLHHQVRTIDTKINAGMQAANSKLNVR